GAGRDWFSRMGWSDRRPHLVCGGCTGAVRLAAGRPVGELAGCLLCTLVDRDAVDLSRIMCNISLLVNSKYERGRGGQRGIFCIESRASYRSSEKVSCAIMRPEPRVNHSSASSRP